MAGTERGRSGHSGEPAKKGGAVFLTMQRRFESVHGEEGVTATVISDGGGLGRRTDGGRQGVARSGDKGGFLAQGEAQIRVERKSEEGRKARGRFTGEKLRSADNVPAAELQRATTCAQR
jgi:hypothetical protein